MYLQKNRVMPLVLIILNCGMGVNYLEGNHLIGVRDGCHEVLLRHVGGVSPVTRVNCCSCADVSSCPS